MSRRANQAQPQLVFVPEHPLDGVTGATGGHQGNLVTARSDDRVHLDVSAARFVEGPDLVDIFGVVDQGKPLARDRLEIRLPAAGHQTRLLQPVGDQADPIRPFRMIAGFVM